MVMLGLGIHPNHLCDYHHTHVPSFLFRHVPLQNSHFDDHQGQPGAEKWTEQLIEL